jgi:hypothetical protein
MALLIQDAQLIPAHVPIFRNIIYRYEKSRFISVLFQDAQSKQIVAYESVVKGKNDFLSAI